MIKLLKIYIINLILCLRLVQPIATTIKYHSKDNSTNHNIIKHLYDKPSKITINMDQYNNNYQLNKRLSTQSYLEKSSAKAQEISYAPSFKWNADEDLLQSSLRKAKQLENKCFLDSLKLALIWWSHTNGSLKETNLRFINHQQQLDLSYRNIGSDEEVLAFIPENMTAVTFSLAYNNLTKAPYQTLQIMGNSLKYLSLKGNSFADIKSKRAERYSDHCLLYEEDLKFPKNQDYVRISINNQKGLGWAATFPYMPSLLELDISDCQIEYIDKRAFKNLTNLKHLYMSHNKMVTIPSNTFFYTPSLQVLDLSFANVGDAFIENIKDSPNVEFVMTFIFGINFEEHVFRYLPNLKYLDLSYSKLNRGSSAAFSHLSPGLKYLSLCYTSLSEFNRRIFNNASLIGLDLSGNTNAACSLTEDFFNGLSESLTYLYFENANLRDLSWVKSLRNLRFLFLAGNNINTLLAEDFMGLKQLQILDLTSNQVVNWYAQVFKHNENLRILSLRENNINVITSDMLNDFSKLMLLSIGRNNFMCDCMLHDLVNLAAFDNRPAQCKGNIWQELKDSIHIHAVHLSQVLQDSKLFTNTSLSSLDIHYLMVSKSLHKLKQSAKKLITTLHSKSKPKMRFIFKALRVYNTSKVCLHQNKSFASHNRRINTTQLKLKLFDYDYEHYWCYNETEKLSPIALNCQRATLVSDIEKELNKLSTYILASVFSLIFIVISGIFIYIKRWHIYYYYSSIKSAAFLSVISKDKLNKFNNLCDENPSMVYDIFVSYCQNDRDWIVEELMPNFEETGDISICLHERDFQIGVTILDNIVSCMERSKVLMFIISSNFLLSPWCQFEMQLAQHHILDLNKDNLILVFLEDIPRSKRPKNLQFLMKVKTFIRWPGGKSKTDVQPEEYKLFWKRLKRSLRNISLNASESKA